MSQTQELHFTELPHYLSVRTITEHDQFHKEGGTVSVEVESKIHVNKVVKLPTLFSVAFVRDKPNTFRSDVLSAIISRYGLKQEPLSYS